MLDIEPGRVPVLYAVRDGEERWRGQALDADPSAIQLSPNGQAVIAMHNQLRLYDAQGRLADDCELDGSEEIVWLQISRDGRQVVARTKAHDLFHWQAGSGKPALHLPLQERSVQRMNLSADGSLVAAANDRSALLFPLDDPERLMLQI